MKKVISILAIALMLEPALAATSNNSARRSVTSKMVISAPRATASTNQLSAMAAANSTSESTTQKSSVRVDPIPVPTVDRREKEKAACINNNIGVGNTFVWASRYSNINNYASMVEDTENPENNICFVKVTLKSNDSKISVDDLPSKYYEMGRDIACGEWVDSEMLRKRILDAKKTARVWGSVGAAVGGAALGVGAMELFGNRAIGGKLEGQKSLSDEELLRSQLLVLKEENRSDFNSFMVALREIKTECENLEKNNAEKPSECDAYDYDYLLSIQ